MYQFPLTLTFKVLSVAPQIRGSDASGKMVAYVREKIFALKDHVTVFFADDERELPLFTIKADRMIDFGGTYAIATPEGMRLGAVKQHGLSSLWRARFDVSGPDGSVLGGIREENPWIKVIDGLVDSIPVVGPVAAMFINPAYSVEMNGAPTLYVRKSRSFFERIFTVEKRGELSDADQELLLNAIVMMVLLEHYRG